MVTAPQTPTTPYLLLVANRSGAPASLLYFAATAMKVGPTNSGITGTPVIPLLVLVDSYSDGIRPASFLDW
ncbi:hypothetical protein [Spirosoma horti]